MSHEDGSGLGDAVLLTLCELRATRALLEKRLATLEARTPFSYEGVFDGSKKYQRGNFVTHDGSLWHAERETRSEPGAGADWKLAVKKGKDARPGSGK